MPRPFSDVALAKPSNPIKNGSLVANATRGGFFEAEQIGAQNSVSGTSGVYGYHNNIYSIPNSGTLATEYGNRFYNGIFVRSIPSGVVAGTGF
jgi:hypothetical protein